VYYEGASVGTVKGFDAKLRCSQQECQRRGRGHISDHSCVL